MKQASHYTAAMAQLIDRLSKLPGLGRRSAERVVFHLLKAPPDEARELAAAITNLGQQTRSCEICGHVDDVSPCSICRDPQRDRSVIMVVEEPRDLAAIETTGMYRGVYHVLMGRLAPLENVGPGELSIDTLVKRVRGEAGHKQPIAEVILALNPTTEGDGTALYLTQQLRGTSAKLTRLARGLPTGVDLERASKAVLADALYARQQTS